jgi:hypothetical protein
LRRPIRRSTPSARGALRARLALAAALLAATAGACSSSGGQPSATAPATATASTSASATATAPTSGPATTPPATTAAGALTLDEHAARTTVRVRTGTAVVVRLHSTYWSTPAASDPRVLAPVGGGSTPSGTCPPGGGCGVSSAGFTAARPGTVRVTAHRDSCGEAMRCAPGKGDYEVTVTVG